MTEGVRNLRCEGGEGGASSREVLTLGLESQLHSELLVFLGGKGRCGGMSTKKVDIGRPLGVPGLLCSA